MTTVNIVSVLRELYILERSMFKLSCGTAQIPGIGFTLSPTPTQ